MNSKAAKQKTARPEIFYRLASAVVLIGVALSITWFGGYSFEILCELGAVLLLFEYMRICGPKISFGIRIATMALLVLFMLAWITDQVTVSLIIATAGIAVLSVSQLISRKNLWAPIGLAYAILPFCALTLFREGEEAGLFIIFLLFGCVWGADSLAYFAGRAIGGPKLAPKISPNKTWAGFFGGLAGALIVSWVIAAWFGYSITTKFIVLVLGLAIISQIGDLAESALKRHFDVKDSGNLIPGHGGVLDRIDGLVAASVGLLVIGLLLDRTQLADDNFSLRIIHAFLMP